jgi:hypothetical protein
VWDSVWDSVRDSVWASVWDSVWASVVASVGASVYGSHDAGVLSFYSYFLDVCGLKACEKLDGLFEQARHCGWWWPFKHMVLATEKPAALHLDERGRLHHATEAAISYGDGWGVYAWHGIRMSWKYYCQEVTSSAILAESNAEVRRALIERYGQDRFMLDSGASVIDTDMAEGSGFPRERPL